MKCGRAGLIDVEAFLIDPGAPQFSSFRSHYPECAECAVTVAGWAAFDVALRQALDAESTTHPSPERLERYAASPETTGEEAMGIEHHLANCRSCQTEIDLLHAYDPEFLIAAAGRIDRNPAVFDRHAASPPLNHLRDLVRSRSRDLVLGWQTALPALSVAVVVFLGLLFWWTDALESVGTRGTATDESRFAQDKRPDPEAPEPLNPANSIFGIDADHFDPRIPETSLDRHEQVADVPNVTTEVPRKSAAHLAEAAPPEKNQQEVSRSTTETDGNSLKSSQDQEILLAALTSLPDPVYSAPPGAESLGWMRQFGAVRAGPTEVTIEARAPENYAGLTLSTSPRLWWTLSDATDLPVQVTLVDEEAIEPLLRIELSEHHSAGLHSTDLAKYNVKLEPEVDYRWFVSILVDPSRPSRNPVAAGALRVISNLDSRREAAAQTIPSERGHTLARLGLWYDAYDFFAALSVAHPNREPIVRHRERLVALAKERH